jgi:hypothetical protein
MMDARRMDGRCDDDDDDDDDGQKDVNDVRLLDVRSMVCGRWGMACTLGWM